MAVPISMEVVSRGVRVAIAVAIAASAAGPLQAHDFWIEPETYRPVVGTLLPVRLRVGQDFRGDSVPRNPELIERFVVVGPAGESPIEGPDAGDPAGIA